jgi:acyl carrier protein
MARRVYTTSQNRYIFPTIRGPDDNLHLEQATGASPRMAGSGFAGAVGVLFRWRKASVSIEEKVIGIVSDQLDVPKEEISRSSSFVDDLKADSLDIVELVMALEDEFDVKIPDEDYDQIKTVGNAITYIESKA